MEYYYIDSKNNKIYIDQNQKLDKIVAFGFNPETDNDEIIEYNDISINQIKKYFKSDLKYFNKLYINDENYIIYEVKKNDY